MFNIVVNCNYFWKQCFSSRKRWRKWRKHFELSSTRLKLKQKLRQETRTK